MLKARNRFPRTWRIRSNITLGVGFTEVLGLETILYYFSIGYLLNSLPINSATWSYMISIGLGYLDSHIFSTKFAIDIALLSLYCVISTYLVTGLITVTVFRFNYSFYPFFLWLRYQLDIHRVYSMVFPRLL